MQETDEKVRVSKIIRDIPKGIIGWYDFTIVQKALYVGSEENAIYEEIKSQVKDCYCVSLTDCMSTDGIDEANAYDLIVCSYEFEKIKNPENLFSKIYASLSEKGHMFILMNNRLGIRNFCGDRDPYTERNFDGVENYKRAYANVADSFNGKCYSENEIADLLKMSGATGERVRFYSVYPAVDTPTFLYASDYMPNEDLSNRITPCYNYPKSVFIDEEFMYNDLVSNNLFHKMANGYLVEVVKSDNFCNVLHVTNSIERGREDALYTIIKKDLTVTKKAIYPEGNTRLINLNNNLVNLGNEGVNVVKGILDDSRLVSYTMPYIKGVTVQKYIKQLAEENKKTEILKLLEDFRDVIMNSAKEASAEEIEEWKEEFRNRQIEKRKARAIRLNREYKPEDVKEDFFDFDLGPVFKDAYIDMVPLNSFYVDGRFVFIDQEFCLKTCPAKVIVYRMIATLYSNDTVLKTVFPMDELLKHFDVYDNKDKWNFIEWDWLGSLCNKDELEEYKKSKQKGYQCTGSNRQRMNYSAEDYQRIFVDIFENTDSRKVILFGSGNFTKKFIKLYGKDINIYRILDNSESKWGTELEGIGIEAPSSLLNMNSTEYKLIVCIKNYISVVKQLDAMGIKGYSIYDGDRTYPKPNNRVVVRNSDDEGVKKYNVGYVAGVFDLFHIGHLNLLRRAKEQCNYLIVGVVSDEGVVKNKRTNPVVPFEERLEIVQACRYVDEAVEIPHGFGDTKDAYNLYHFDVQFSGSDYAEDKEWLEKKKFLNDHGSDLVFFPYTQSTSSTKRKKELKDR